ncbi:MAG: NADH-quinone oxidoreductase subunit NuoG [Alphaproteobacteria bacterium]|nr:NADH-quinone oxidoreductase subunit NuoG [Alphaproteobacteria bacterium]
MITLTINDTRIDVERGTTILGACRKLGIEIPVFCYHPKLSIAGNCRMCLVDVAGSPKPMTSCCTAVSDGMIVNTNTPNVEKARKGVLELLLINHPLDCPVCDQGGECDLQDITFNYGCGTSRFDLDKRIVADKNMGPLIKTVMTRCIHCTRCIRFAQEIAGIPEIGTTGRGDNTEITTYLEKSLSSELSGNLIDICPVGALTNKPAAFQCRSWELTKMDTIDVMDAVGSNIRIDARGQEILRIVPRSNDLINEDWISDRTRFSYDGLKVQRLDKPYMRVNGKLQPCSWDQAFAAIQSKIKGVQGSEIAAFAGDQADCESMLVLKELMTHLGSPHTECRQDGSRLPADARCHYIMNTTIAGIERADCLLLVGTNPRFEAPLVNARIRKRYLMGNFPIALVGESLDLTYPYEFLSQTPLILTDLLQGSHPFSETLGQAQRPALILGQGALNRADSHAILKTVQDLLHRYRFLREDWNGYNVLHTAAGRVGGFDMGFTSDHKKKDSKIVYLLGADELAMDQFGDAFVIYQGHHGDVGANRADVILPGAAYTEKNATFVNTEGRVQQTRQVIAPPGDAKEDWRIICLLAEKLGAPLSYRNLDDIRIKINDRIAPSLWQDFTSLVSEDLTDKPFSLPISNFYKVDPISRHSQIMTQCMDAV